MDKHSIDFANLDKKLNGPKLYKLAEVQDRIEKVGFGLVRFVDEKNKTGLWQIVQGEDGTEYIGAMYESNNEPVKTSCDWTIETDKLVKNATVFYKNTPITVLPLSSIGIKQSEINNFKNTLPERLASNKELVRLMVNGLSDDYKNRIANMYPELVQ